MDRLSEKDLKRMSEPAPLAVISFDNINSVAQELLLARRVVMEAKLVGGNLTYAECGCGVCLALKAYDEGLEQ